MRIPAHPVLFFFSILIALLLSSPVSALDQTPPKVDVDISQNSYEDQPVKGKILITHSASEKIDENSFLLDGKKIIVSLDKVVKVSPDGSIEISIYAFEIPGNKAGLYLLHPISVNIGDHPYRSIAESYEIKRVSSPAGANKRATLNINARADLPHPFYPGLRGKLIYRIQYEGKIGLTKEELPLLEAQGFIKINEKQIHNTTEGQVSVQEIIQEIQAKESGVFTFPPSILEGYAYVENAMKEKTYEKTKLHSQAPNLEITVTPFPSGMPADFNGAVGTFRLKANLISPGPFYVDDKLTLSIEVQGDNLQTVSMPNLYTDSFRRLFRFSDLPPLIEKKGTTKQFFIDLYPLSSAVKEIPSISFSYFEPKSNRYVTLKTEPIALAVQEKTSSAPIIEAKQEEYQPTTIPINGVEELQLQPPILSVSFLTILLVGMAGLLFQYALKTYLTKKAGWQRKKNSSRLWQQALKLPLHSPAFFPALVEAFFLRLSESGQIESKDYLIDELMDTGWQGKVKALLREIEASKYTQGTIKKENLKKAKALFNELKRVSIR